MSFQTFSVIDNSIFYRKFCDEYLSLSLAVTIFYLQDNNFLTLKRALLARFIEFNKYHGFTFQQIAFYQETYLELVRDKGDCIYNDYSSSADILEHLMLLSDFDQYENESQFYYITIFAKPYLFSGLENILTWIKQEIIPYINQSSKNDEKSDDELANITKQKNSSTEKNFIWDEEMLIGYVKTGELSKLSVSLASKENKMYVSLSKLYRTKTDPTFKFSKGFTMPIEKAEQIASLIQKAALEGGEIIIGKQGGVL